MPPVPTKPKQKQKAGRRDVEGFGFDGGHAREVEQKRNTGQISCAECRRYVFVRSSGVWCQAPVFTLTFPCLILVAMYISKTQDQV